VRIALDSSVLIAAHISRAGVCAEMLEVVLLHHELVTSGFILEELRRKLVEKFNFPSAMLIRSALSFVALALL
jgi:predicted nucleic acid-binding protein